MKAYTILMATSLLALAACADDSKDRVATETCQNEGFTPGTADYDKCISSEKAAHRMEQQQQEFEQMKQYQQDQTMRRY